MTEEHERSCLCCKHLDLCTGSQGYSSWTPASPVELTCDKEVFKGNAGYDASLLETAKDCNEFEHR